MKIAAFMVGLSFSLSAYAGTAFLKYEYTTGMTKQCVYDYLGNQFIRTMSATSLCPLSITV